MSKLNISRDFERKVKNYYSKNYVVHSHSSFIFRLRRLRVLEQIRKRKSQMCFDDVLEVGGGPKILYQCVLEKCKKYYALDITKANLELIEKESTKVSPIHSDLDRYTPNDQFFDFILAIGVLEYTHYPLENLKKLIGLLKSNGIIICSLPNRLSPYRIWSSYIYQPISYILRLLLRKENFYYNILAFRDGPEGQGASTVGVQTASKGADILFIPAFGRIRGIDTGFGRRRVNRNRI